MFPTRPEQLGTVGTTAVPKRVPLPPKGGGNKGTTPVLGTRNSLVQPPRGGGWGGGGGDMGFWIGVVGPEINWFLWRDPSGWIHACRAWLA